MNSEDDILFPFPIGNQLPKKIATRTVSSTQYRIRLTGVVGSIESYADEIEILENATENDQVLIQISSPGGSLETCDFFVRRMIECRAHIIVEIGMMAASAASAFVLQADDWIIGPSSTLMIHPMSYGIPWGKESDVRLEADIGDRMNREFFTRTYAGFLSEEEIETALKFGQDLYFFADELEVRLKAYDEYREQQVTAEVEEAAQEIAAILPVDSSPE